MSSKFHQMQVKHLFSAQHAVRAVQVLKARNWSQLNFLELVASIDRYGPAETLAEPALKMIFQQLSSVTNPLIRHLCLEKLGNRPDFSSSLCAAFLNSEDVELACKAATSAPAGSEELAPEILANLIELGAFHLEPHTEAMWSRLFEYCVANDRYARAKELWNNRPAKMSGFSEKTLLKFVDLIGRHQDLTTLKSFLVGTKHELPLTSGAVAACLTCLLDDPRVLLQFIKDNENLLAQRVALSDLKFVSDTLTTYLKSELAQNLGEIEGGSTFLGNIILQGFYRQNTSQTVFQFYRWLVTHRKFHPDTETAQILANSAYRLGNSKLLAHEIYKEHSHLALDRKFFETMLACQLTGSNYSSLNYFLAEMARKAIPLRAHMRRLISNKFEKSGDTDNLVELARPHLENRYTKFDEESAARESSHAAQARANAEMYVNGKSPDEEPLAVLAQMLQFDDYRSSFRS